MTRKPGRPIKSIVGRKFGHLTALVYAGSKNIAGRKSHGSLYVCRCSCGKTRTVLRNNLVSGNTRSCGHLQRFAVSKAGRAARQAAKVAQTEGATQ